MTLKDEPMLLDRRSALETRRGPRALWLACGAVAAVGSAAIALQMARADPPPEAVAVEAPRRVGPADQLVRVDPDAPDPVPGHAEGISTGSFADPAEFANDATYTSAGFPPGTDLAPAFAGLPERTAFFAAMPHADAFGGQIVSVSAPERANGRDEFLVVARRKERMPIGNDVEPSRVMHLEKWELKPDGTVAFLRSGSSRGPYTIESYDF